MSGPRASLPATRSARTTFTRRGALVGTCLLLAVIATACASEPGDPGDPGADGSDGQSTDGGGDPSNPTTDSSPPGGAMGLVAETVEIAAWFNPALDVGRVRTRIANPIATNSSFVSFGSRTITSGTESHAWVDGVEVAITGSGSVPFDFGVNAVVEFETTFPMWSDEPFDVDGRLLVDWFPTRSGVPSYIERVHYNMQVWAPTEVRLGGDLQPCVGEALGPTDGLVCVSSIDRGAPPFMLIPEVGEAETTGASGRFRITGEVRNPEALAAFGDAAVATLSELLGPVMPQRIEALIGDVAGEFAGQAIGSMLMLDREYVEGSSTAGAHQVIAHELAHAAQDHRTQVSGADDPGSAMIESMAEYLAYRVNNDPARQIIANDTNWLLVNASEGFGELAGKVPLSLLQRVEPVGSANDAYIRIRRDQQSLRYRYLPRAWADQERAWGTAEMDAFLRDLHSDAFEGGFVLRRVLAFAEQRPGGEVLRSYWETPIPADWDNWS